MYICDSNSGPLFVTAVRQCGIPEKLSYQATTRQLLVGMTNLELLSQTPVSIADTKALRSTFRGVIDADTVLAATFTQREDDCITDLVVWKATSPSLSSSEEIDPFNLAATEIATMIRPEHLLSQRG